jgi:anhydro-N-acetylmuramic acid kinase
VVLAHLSAKTQRRIVGLMSGTSVDGIDAVLIALDDAAPDKALRLLAFQTLPFSAELQQQVFDIFAPNASIDALCRLNFSLGEAFAAAALQVIAAARLTPQDIDLIGSHGQTIRHLPDQSPASTLQVGEAAVIAQRTGITTVSDFRPADMAQGGQGAPLVPLADQLLFSHAQHGRLLLNIGGIANLTVLPPGNNPANITAFDLGPGNALIDAAIRRFTLGRQTFDRDGVRAAAGQPDEEVLANLMAHPFLQKNPPKSTGRESFGAPMLDAVLAQKKLTDDDWLATLTAFTAQSIAFGIRRFVPHPTRFEAMYVAGGGSHNRHLINMLQKDLEPMLIAPSDQLGIPADAREAISFAILANETLMGRPGNVPSATGASALAVLGKITLA